MRVRSGWPLEADAEHVERLALERLGARATLEQRRQLGLASGTWTRTAAAGVRVVIRSTHDLEALRHDPVGQRRGRVGR
jgi:hypothetical protein